MNVSGSDIVVGVVAVLAFWNAANVERLKFLGQERLDGLSREFAGRLQLLKLDLDRSRKAYDQQVLREFELYETVYPKIVDAYYSLLALQSMETEPDVFEAHIWTPEQIAERKQRNMDEADKLLGFIQDVERKQALIPKAVYREIDKFWRMGVDKSMVTRYPNLHRPPIFEEHMAASDEELKEQLENIADAIRSSLSIVDPSESRTT